MKKSFKYSNSEKDALRRDAYKLIRGLHKTSIDKIIDYETIDLNNLFDYKDKTVRKIVAQTIKDGYFLTDKCRKITSKGHGNAIKIANWLQENEIIEEVDICKWRTTIKSMKEFDKKFER